MRCNKIPHCSYDYRFDNYEEFPEPKVKTATCICCDEELAEDGIWFHDWDPVEGEINVCPDCWLEHIWNTYITGCSYETFLDLIVASEKKERKRIWDTRN